ncbi:hypothetical protein ACFY2K_10975 [Kitasatospora sp. NPDC001309]|uniref:hypothetical protein n=1 Tax=Kitasatospora sp. NPDC001309 TaxID=3364013 RepID=UPI00369D829D
MDKALPLTIAARETRECGPVADVVLQVMLILTTSEGLPDLRRSGGRMKAWMADLLDAAGLVPPPLSTEQERKRVARERQSLAQAIREALSPVRVAYIQGLDDKPEERSRLFPGFASSDEIFAHFKIIPKAQSEIRAETYQRRTALQKIGAAVLSSDGAVSPDQCADVVSTVHRTVAALTPASFQGLDPQTRDQLRQELSETRAALLALEDSLS